MTRYRSSLSATLLVVVMSFIATISAPVTAGAQATGAGATTPGSSPAKSKHVTTPILSARRVPSLLTAHIADQKLQAAVQDVLKDAPPTSCFEVSEHGRTVFRMNGDLPVEPASTNKLLTASSILQVLKPDAKISTTVVAQGKPENGIVHGNVWLVGGGDSMLTTAGYKPTFDDTAQLSSDFGTLADALHTAGIIEIDGDVVGDDSRYDAERSVSTWTNNVKKEAGPLSSLLVNDGTTGYSTSPDKPTKVRKPGDPPVLAAETLKTMLTDRGVAVTGNPVAGKAPGGTVELARLDTPLSDLMTEMLSWSDNTTAELMLKELGVVVNHTGTTAAGVAAVTSTLTGMGLPMKGVVLNDGSGLDNADRLTCDLLTQLLDKQGPDSPLAKTLSITGQRGTLRKRMRGTPMDGKVTAKTGTLATVAGLAGFETTRSNDVLTFSLVQNGVKDADTQAREDQLAAAMFEYPQAPSADELGPKPPVTS